MSSLSLVVMVWPSMVGRSWSYEPAAGLAHDPAMLGNEIAAQIDAVDAALDGAALQRGVVRLAQLLTVLDQGRLRRVENDEVRVGPDLQRAFARMKSETRGRPLGAGACDVRQGQ